MAREKSESYENTGEYMSDSDTSSESSFRIVAARAVEGRRRVATKRHPAQPAKWREEDVILLLEAIIQFQQEKEGETNVNKKAYYDFLKKKLWEGVTTTQIYEKLRKLKRNFQSAQNKSGEGKTLSLESCDNRVFMLCRKIWGGSTNHMEKEGSVMSVKEKENVADSTAVIKDFWERYRYLYHSVDRSKSLVRDHLFLLGEEKGKELDDEWKCLNLEMEELKQQMEELEYEQTALILSAIKSNTM